MRVRAEIFGAVPSEESNYPGVGLAAYSNAAGVDSVLITGGTGSFGRAFTQRVLAAGAQRVCIFSRDEHKQAEMRESFNNDPRLRFFIGDVRDKDRLRWAMGGVSAVVHAAALKRIEVGVYNPVEMVRTNIGGAVNVIQAAIDSGVSRVVALSTDKAYQPVSPYGASKALAESLFLSANNTRGADGPVFFVTRYGNVAGSNGSVIPLWRKILASGKKTVPVTDPDCTRFWMTLDEAVQLVLDALSKSSSESLIIPRMLPAYRLADLAEAMGADMDIRGLGDWEKKHEGMCDGVTSDGARRMTIAEIRAGLEKI